MRRNGTVLLVVGGLVGLAAFSRSATAKTAILQEVAACRVTGCPGGDQLCAEVKGGIGVSGVTWYCHKQHPAKPKPKK